MPLDVLGHTRATLGWSVGDGDDYSFPPSLRDVGNP